MHKWSCQEKLVVRRFAAGWRTRRQYPELVGSAKLNGHDPWAYLKDVFERLPMLKNRDLAQLLPHNWHAPAASTRTVTPVVVPAAAVA
ncbi:MAG: transposase domain-containing protein [Rubrivivax sp.]|nr:transposase domain-containing protein [Rubrivivax sp.]